MSCDDHHIPVFLCCRVVLRGERMIEAVNPESVEVFNFKEEFGLTEQEVNIIE